MRFLAPAKITARVRAFRGRGHARGTRRTRVAAACLLAAAGATIAASTSQAASTSTSVVGATVLSSTTIDPTGCASGVAGKTDFGTVTASSSNITTLDCAIAFGSTNDSSQLRIRQSDQLGLAMWSPTRGVLDTSFDTDGKVTTATAPGAASDSAHAVAVQGDGKIVSVGECTMGATGVDACLARYNTDGSLDTTFDTDGRVTTATAPGAADDFQNAVTVQADGKIVTAGWCDMGGATGIDACLARYNPDGSLDTTFDTDGRVTTATAPGTDTDIAFAIAVQANGQIVTAGQCNMLGATGWDACLARYDPDGSLDTTFDTDGRVTTATGPGTASDHDYGVVVQPDGKIVASGRCDMGGATGSDACVMRYNTNGTLDTTFDTDGRVTTAIAPGVDGDYLLALALQADGRIVIAGYCEMGGATGIDACLVRYNADGSLDTTFDTDGRVTTPTGPGGAPDTAYAVTLQADGKIVTAGRCDTGVPTGIDACLARYNLDGSLDTTFSSDGLVTTATSPGLADDYASAVAMQADGKIVTAGHCDLGGATGTDACLASYDAYGLVSQYADDGVSDWDTAGAAPNFFGACLRSVSGGAAAQWATTGACPATDGAYWNAVPTTSAKVAYNVALEPDPTDATANLRFGLRTSGNQPAGAYIAPITFDVLAPNA